MTGAISCPADRYDAGHGECLLIQTSPNPVACPMDLTNPPPSGRPTCQGSVGGMYRIHVGGQRLEWEPGTDAMCLSAEPTPKPAAYNTAKCQDKGKMALCENMLKLAGCLYSIGTANWNIITIKQTHYHFIRLSQCLVVRYGGE